MKKCPLLILGVYANSDEKTHFFAKADDCMKENCAWWDDYDERCSVYSIQKELSRVGQIIGSLKIEA